ncbi:Zinc finger protein ZPR1 [Echinococcus granulosus]|uniref:Zinc finger protein ZPR1 n=1 Tax=Echinococcus granulosus TaxID=6210 RepID=U6JEQ7_ECHGR|nr:Zinc finger protein ZPR1 [Echinococcus granulosus]EUB55621.1 Zinc finger protein ZPR1 [Echinococcus granulosus]KAH9287018.1 Zinc finger protein ZPR1 [Echinococcus granulosus]CDS22585.1 zinc finger protein ZPR1 [Echinococcus granulosus]
MEKSPDEVGPTVRDLDQDAASEVVETESLCLNCRKNGTTRMLITRIPFFREVVISSFECEHCGFTNRSVDPAAPIQEKGRRFTLDVRCAKDLNRRVIQPSHSEIRIPSLDSSFPSSESALTTVEGVITGIIDKLEFLQPDRRKANPKQAELIDAFIGKLRSLLTLKTPFQLEMDDPSGNGFIENLHAPLNDPQITCVMYTRTAEQDKLLGFRDDNAPTDDKDDKDENIKDSVSTFQVTCPNCHSDCPTNMKVVDIPYFQEVVLMAINCSLCGYRSNEVKSIAGIAERGKQFRLLIATEEDLSRDILKSDTASVALPELGIDSEPGTLGGRFTTVEGLLRLIKDQFKSMNPLLFGDSSDQEEKTRLLAVTCDKIDEVLSLIRKDAHLVLNDPAGNSYLQSLNPEGTDERLEVEEYQRSQEQNEELGITDMKTENY